MLLPSGGQQDVESPSARAVGTVKEFAHEASPLIQFKVAGLELHERLSDKGYDTGIVSNGRHIPGGNLPEILINTWGMLAENV